MIPPVEKLDAGFAAWLEKLALKMNSTVDETALVLGGQEKTNDEIIHRLDYYPILSAIFQDNQFDLDLFAETIKNFWVLDTYAKIRLKEFFNNSEANNIVMRLVSDFPESDSDASGRIDSFLEEMSDGGYQKQNGSKDSAGAALFASVILTSTFPERFVDYRRNRWKRFAQQVGYDDIPKFNGYGEQLIWAGAFSKALTKTNTFRRFWPEKESNWIMAGISWQALEKELEQGILSNEFSTNPSVSEGGQKQKLHFFRERSRVIVKMAKDAALQRDGILRCEVCQFCFQEFYGRHGTNFIEAHHRIPISKLEPDTQTKISDLALVCSNCHRMIHRGKKTLSVNELKKMIQRQTP